MPLNIKLARFEAKSTVIDSLKAVFTIVLKG